MFRLALPAVVAMAGGCDRGLAATDPIPEPGVPPGVEAATVAPMRLPAQLPPFSGTLTFVPGSTAKVETLIGDVDRETGQPTLSLTETRYGIAGTDLGSSFEHGGRTWFLFGDTLGPQKGDPLATTGATSGDDGVRLDFQTADDGSYLRVRPDGVSMGPFEVPVAGISLLGVPYVVVKTGYAAGDDEERSILTRYDEDAGTFTELRELSRRPTGGFVRTSLHRQPGRIPGLPAGGPWVLAWGTGEFRKSDAWLSIVPARTFETGTGTLYFSGDGPTWTDDEARAVPVVEHPTMGDLSVTWVEALRVWLMVYDSRDPRGVLLRWSATPWGPWSEPQTLFHRDEGAGLYIHDPDTDDGLAGPMIGEHKDDPGGEPGSAYAPYVVERFTRVEGDTLSIWFTLSTWNPYLVVLMRSDLEIRP